MSTWTLLVNLTLKSTAVLALAWLLALALRRRSAAARHIVWTAAFAVLLALPLLSISLPAWPHPFANAILVADSGVTFHANAAAPRAAALGSANAAAPQLSGKSGPAVPRFDPRRAAMALWACGALLGLLQMAWAYAAVGRLSRQLAPAPWHPSEFGISEPVRLLETGYGMPMAAGVFRPAIFLPAESAAWTWERVRVVVLHEYAHIVRGDAAAHLVARLSLSLHWFNPLAWLAWREFLKERERAADDLVLGAGAVATDYAGHLLEIARTMQSAPAGAAAGIAMARRSQLEGRLLAILDSRVKRSAPGRAALAAAVVAALLLAAPLATVRAQSQAEQQPPADVDAVIAAANARKNHELLDQAAAAYEKLRQFTEAQKLREAALAIRKLSGNAQYAEGLVRLGQLAQKRNANAEAMQYYTRAVEVGDMPQTVPALIELGLDAAFGFHISVNPPALGKNLPLAIDYLQRARNAAKSGNDIGRAMTWLAFVQQDDAAKIAEVESMYRTALALEDPGSSQAALTSGFLARFLNQQGRVDEAATLQASAATAHRALVASLSPKLVSTVSGARKVGGGVTAPALLYKVEPSYSEEARALKFQGTVLLKVVIDVDGRAKDIQVVRLLGMGLDEKAAEAVTAWKFRPGEAGGVPVPVQAQIEVNFRLL